MGVLTVGRTGKREEFLLSDNAYDLSGSVQAIYVENHAEEWVDLSLGQKLGTVHSMCIDKEAWIKEELRGHRTQDLDEKEVGLGQESVNSLQESDFPTEESKRKLIKESFKIDENKIFNRDEQLKALHPNHYGKTDLLELRIELEPGAYLRDPR